MNFTNLPLGNERHEQYNLNIEVLITRIILFLVHKYYNADNLEWLLFIKSSK
jgi:hypothetical protein